MSFAAHPGLYNRDRRALIVKPVMLGGGKSIFPEDGTKATFELVSTTAALTGTQVCVYRTAKDA
jgi:dihydrofolate reductase